MISDVDHIGIAVSSIATVLPFYTDSLGLKHIGTEEVPSEQVRVAILMTGTTRIELLEPTSDDSPISSFLRKRGGGVHHIAYRVGNIAREVERLRAAGDPVIDPAPRPGAGGCMVAFIHPKGSGGILVELVQRAPANTPF